VTAAIRRRGQRVATTINGKNRKAAVSLAQSASPQKPAARSNRESERRRFDSSTSAKARVERLMTAASLLKVPNEKITCGVSPTRKNAAEPALTSRTIAPAQLQRAGTNRTAQKQLTRRGGHHPLDPTAPSTYRFGG